MNTEDTAIPFRLSPLAEGDAPKRVVPHPTDEYLTRQALLTDPAKVGDEESRAAALRSIPVMSRKAQNTAWAQL